MLITLTRQLLDGLLDGPLPEEQIARWFGYLNPDEIEKLRSALLKFHIEGIRSRPSFLDVLRLAILGSVNGAGYVINDISRVILVGNSMNVPQVRRAIREVFTTNQSVRVELQRIEREGFAINPLECVARGASQYTQICSILFRYNDLNLSTVKEYL